MEFIISLYPLILDWLDLIVRWIHVVVGIAWIGTSFYFNWLDSRLDRQINNVNIEGELWSVHSGGFYRIEKLKGIFSCLVLLATLLLSIPSIAEAKLQFHEGENDNSYVRSLESLRDLDYQTWQLVAYPSSSSEDDLVLRIVGYPGTLRMDHPNALKVHAGLRDWLLKDITSLNPELANDPREAAAEFELSPLIKDLSNNRPLRLRLSGVFIDLPIPPYVVKEWRSLLEQALVDEKT